MMLASARQIVTADRYVAAANAQGTDPLGHSVGCQTVGVGGARRHRRAIATAPRRCSHEWGGVTGRAQARGRKYVADLVDMAQRSDLLMVAPCKGGGRRRLISGR